MPKNPSAQFSGARCTPIINPEDALQRPVALAPGTYPAGQLVGEITATNVNDVQTITVTSSTGGTFIVSVPWNNQTLTVVAAYNIPTADLQAALAALANVGTSDAGVANVAVTGTAGASYVITAAGALAGRLLPAMTVTDNTTGSGHSVTIAHTTSGVGPKNSLGLYVDANTDGTGVAQGILEYACYVDLYGNITTGVGVTQTGGVFGESEKSTPMWMNGVFDIGDLVGLDAAAVTDLTARFVRGSLAGGSGSWLSIP